MKKRITMFLTIALCLLLTACGSAGAPTQAPAAVPADAAAISPEAAPEVVSEAASETAPAAAPETASGLGQPVTADSVKAVIADAMQKLAANTVRDYMEKKGSAGIRQYEELTGMTAEAASVVHAMDYRLGNWDGHTVHFLLIYLDADIAAEKNGEVVGFNDNVQLLLDMDSGELYDSTMIDDRFFESFNGVCSSMEEIRMVALNAYYSYVRYQADSLWVDMETREELSLEDIAKINQALQ